MIGDFGRFNPLSFYILGVSLHTFHGNFFVRSTDLLSLPNINPDAGFAMQMSIEDTIDSTYFSFQAALLYTSSKGTVFFYKFYIYD